ncbi:MAG: ATP synthase F1 subunit delta [Clostridia bacterium]|nr:ATP synthase F1 subunit delta [Clostridia bacterium]
MTELAREYGEGLYALCAEENLTEDALSQLQTLKSLFREEPDFIRLLSNMSLGKQERVGILDGALRGQVHPYLLNFLKILCERGALHEFEGCESAFRECYNRDHAVVEATVTTTAPLSDGQRLKLLKKLRDMTGKTVRLSEKTDPAVIGGVLLEMNGQRYDNTVRHRLEEIRRAMAGEP